MINLKDKIEFRPHKRAEELLGDHKQTQTGKVRMRLLDFIKILGPELHKGIIKNGEFKVLKDDSKDY